LNRLLLISAALALTGCNDPVHSQMEDALGGEVPGVPRGPLHRPGQPCLVCHGGEGPGNPTFSLAGTVVQNQGSIFPLANALVKFIDSAGKKYETATNCAGNFFVMPEDYTPVYPAWVKIAFGTAGAGPVEQIMGSPIYREGSCAGCHAPSAGPDAAGPVYFAPAGVPFPPQCQ
jgi:hypothetical protein